MKKGIVPGLILAVIGVGLFAYQGFRMSQRIATVSSNVTARTVRRAQFTGRSASNDQSFPAASVLAGILFMSGVGLAAISANPSLQSRAENIESFAASSGDEPQSGRY